MKSNRMGPTVVTTLLMGLASCGTSIQDLQPASATGAAKGSPPARLVSEADYTRYGPNMISFCGAGAAARAQPGFTGTPRTSFYTAEGIVAVTDVTWPESTSDAGLHHVDWRLFQGDTVLKEKHSDERLCSKPSRVLSYLSAGSFAPGTYRLDLLLDQKPFATLPFKLLAAQTPAPLTTPITGPKCKGAAQTETARPHLMPVNQVPAAQPTGTKAAALSCPSSSIMTGTQAASAWMANTPSMPDLATWQPGPTGSRPSRQATVERPPG
jgi:hypothetical protein